MVKLILWATVDEAASSLAYLKAESVEINLWRYSEGWIAVSGWGCKNSYNACIKYAKHVDEIWNIGIAGALKDNLELGSLHEIHTVGTTTLPLLSFHTDGLSLFSSDTPVHDHLQRRELSQSWDLVDMEGYGVVTAAHQLQKKCHLRKLISDFAKEDTRQLIGNDMKKNSEKLAEAFHLK